MRKRRNIPDSHSRQTVPRLALTHGQTLRLLSELGFQEGVSSSTFNHYLKSLRKLGVPFEYGKNKSQRRRVTYNFEELMELSIALLLRVYWTTPDAVIAGLRGFRNDLRRIYREAYFELTVHKYPPATISARKGLRTIISGLYLDLNIRYSAGQMIEFGPPRAISPFEAASRYASTLTPARSYLPLNVSIVAGMIASRAPDIPSVPRGAAAHSSRTSSLGRWKS
jgi:hypothetical protein